MDPNVENIKEEKDSGKRKIRYGLIIGIVSMVIAFGILFVIVIKYINSNLDVDNDVSKFNLSRINFECKNNDVCDGLNDNIVMIKDLNLSSKSINGIILDRNGNAYLKKSDDIIKLDGNTRLKSINYVVKIPTFNDLIVVGDEGIYYVDVNNLKISEYELSAMVKSIIDVDDNGNVIAVDKEGYGVIYYNCNKVKDDVCYGDIKWGEKRITEVLNVDFVSLESLVINHKLYFKDLIKSKDFDNELIIDNIDRVWALDDFSSYKSWMVLSNNNDLYFLQSTPNFQYLKFNVLIDDNVKDVYFISGGSYGQAVVVGERSVFLVNNTYNDKYEKYIEVKKIDNINNYISNIISFYSDGNKLFVLFDDGNTYLVEEFLEK